MNKKRTLRWVLCFLLLGILEIVLFYASLTASGGRIPAGKVLYVLLHGYADTTAFSILWNLRIPRALTAALLGGGLSVSGFLLQSFFRNPIAGPFVLGISSGAKLTVALTMIGALQGGYVLGSWALVLAAFAGSLASMFAVLAVSGKVQNMAQLVITGVMIGYICNALTDFAVTFADDANIVNLHNWSRGSFSGANWRDMKWIAALILIGTVGAFLMSKQIAAYQLGEGYARNMGVPIKLFRVMLVLISSLLSACVTAFAGPVSFVGIAVPHIVKGLFGTAKPIILIPAAFLGGSVFCMGCDMLARVLFAPQELSVSTVTAVFGAPVVIWVMLRRERERRAS